MNVVGAAGAIGLAAAMVAPRWAVRVTGLIVCIAACLILALELAPDGHAGLYAGVTGVGVVVAVALAALFVRVPWALAPLALACVPAAIDVDVGQSHGRLLVPLYVVVAGAALALVWRPGRGHELGLVAWPLGLLVAWGGVSLLWSDDVRAGELELVLFLLPLGLLALALARAPWRAGVSTFLAIELIALGVGLAVVGGVQYLTREVKVGVDQAVVSGWYYRVGPAFDDAGAYAIFLVVATVVALAVAARVRDPRLWALAAVASVVLWLGLVPSFSRPALVALAAAAVALLVALWWPRATLPVALALVVAAVAVGSYAAVREHVVSPPGGGGASIYDAIRVARDHPFAGVGLATREVASAPAAVAGQLGLPGLLLLAATVAAGLVLALRPAGGTGDLALGLALLALAVDSVFRGSLLRDPLLWGVLGLAAAAARTAPRSS